MNEYVNPKQAISLIYDNFFKVYHCPNCFRRADKLKDEWWNHSKPELNEYHCDCKRLRFFPKSNHFIHDKLIAFHLNDDYQWIFYNVNSGLNQNVIQYNHHFDIIPNTADVCAGALLNIKPIIELDYIPSAIFKPLSQMEQAINTMITFQ